MKSYIYENFNSSINQIQVKKSMTSLLIESIIKESDAEVLVEIKSIQEIFFIMLPFLESLAYKILRLS